MTTTIRLADDVIDRLDTMARATSRSRTWVIKQAIERYLEYEEWFVGQVKKGLEEAVGGQIADHESVAEEWELRRAAKVDPES